jgi:hypothetical protein
VTIAWMIYGVVAAALIGIAAVAVERGVQLMRGAVRWIWCAAIVTTVGLVALVPVRAIRTMS